MTVFSQGRLSHATMAEISNKLRQMTLQIHGFQDHKCTKLRFYESPSMELKIQLLGSHP